LNLELEGKVAIVTGSSRGLGLASAIALAREGCAVCVCARGEARLREAVDEVASAAGRAQRGRGGTADVATAGGA